MNLGRIVLERSLFGRAKPDMRIDSRAVVVGALLILVSSSVGRAQDALDTVLKIERGGKGVAAAQAAAEAVLAKGMSLEAVLAKAEKANPVSKNWLIAIAQCIADKQSPQTVKPLLEKILADSKVDSDVRYWALDRLAGGDAKQREKLLEGRTEDACLDIRYEAIELAQKNLPSTDSVKSDEAAKKKLIASYEQLLRSARLADQVLGIAARLKELEVVIDLRKHFGFVSQWQVVGPFDNRKEVGYPVAYPPEDEYSRTGKSDAKSRYPGKAGEVPGKQLRPTKKMAWLI